MVEYIKLNEEEINETMPDFPLWNYSDNCIIKEFVANNFASAIGFVNAIAIIAEKLDHHPDILIYGWNKIRIKIFTHVVNGLTKRDFELASKIDELGF